MRHKPGDLVIDGTAEIAYLTLAKGQFAKSKTLDKLGLVFDLDSKGNLLGIEFIYWPASLIPRIIDRRVKKARKR
jgi:uncharacterized protein YuzE